jgi:adenine-specific DNA-methyltransferase
MPLELPGPTGYCNKQLIPYLGNKRALLPRLMPVLEGLNPDRHPWRFLDPFSGSGSVSRLARAMGMRVEANDWEPYSEAINKCWLGLSPTDVDFAFGGYAGLASMLEEWNSMHPQSTDPDIPDSARGSPYIARWYAPGCTQTPELDKERLFYTAENAAFIDRVRTRIETEYPHPAPGSAHDIQRIVLLGALLLEAATHANTSGVFKAYHRGFGGNGKDALGRILGRMTLEIPILPENIPALVACEDAATFLAGRPTDIVYLDPPYNQHQYGSNYHILNTIVRWDGTSMPMTGSGDVSCSRKAGIPESWKRTRSKFCSKPAVRDAILEVLDATDAAHIVFSWNADGHLSGAEIAEILSARGRLEIIALDYTAYRGGRQSAAKNTGSREYLFLVNTRSAGMGKGRAAREICALASIDEAVRATYDPGRVAACFGLSTADNRYDVTAPDPASNVVPVDRALACGFFQPDLRASREGASVFLGSMDEDIRNSFMQRLASCACTDSVEQLSALQGVVERAIARGERAKALRALREVPRWLRKLAHRKYEDSFKHFLEIFRNLGLQIQDRILITSLSHLEQLMTERIAHNRRSNTV